MRSGNSLVALAVCGLVLAGLAAETVRARRLLGANVRLRAVEVTSMRAAQLGRRAEPLLLANLAVLRDAQRMDSAEIGVRVARGSVYFLLGRLDEAIAGYEDALRLEPRPEIFFNIGRARLAQGDRAAADAAFARAIRLDPRLERELKR